MSDKLYQVVWLETGKPFEGTLPPSTDEAALKQALTEMLEDISGLRGKLEVRPIAEEGI